jgi:uncharacterized protein
VSYPVLVDTSAFHALQNAGDVSEHEIAGHIAVDLEGDRAVLVTTNYILDETYTLLRQELGHPSAVAFGRQVGHGGIEIVQIGEALQRDAWGIFEGYGDKDFSFTDCTSFAFMRSIGLDLAFTFDRHFQQFGFRTLPSRLPRRKK